MISLLILSVVHILLKTSQPFHLRKYIFKACLVGEDLFSQRTNVPAWSLYKSIPHGLKHFTALWEESIRISFKLKKNKTLSLFLPFRIKENIINFQHGKKKVLSEGQDLLKPSRFVTFLKWTLYLCVSPSRPLKSFSLQPSAFRIGKFLLFLI